MAPVNIEKYFIIQCNLSGLPNIEKIKLTDSLDVNMSLHTGILTIL